MEFKAPLYYDDIYEAIDLQIMVSGKSKKELAAVLYPGRQIETAKSLFSRAMSPEYTEVSLSIEKLMALLDQAGAEHIIYYLCDRYFFQRPQRRSRTAAEIDYNIQVENLIRQFEAMTSQVRKLRRSK